MKRIPLLTPTVRLVKSLAVSVALFAIAGTCEAQTVYSEDFDVNHTANWTANVGAGNNDADFFFDYSTVGIPSAPNSTGGTTIGLKLRANFATSFPPPAGVTTGISVSPNGQSFSGNYRLTFDFWSNFNGNANGSGSGTTQLTGAGIGTTGTTPQHANAAPNSLWFAQTGDGGNSATSKDYRAYSSTTGAGTGYAVASGVYAAGTGTTVGDSANAYYASLGGNTVPAAQTTMTPTQTGTTPAGAPGFKWHTGEILKLGNLVKYSIDGLLIFSVDASTVTLSGGNIEFIQSDVNGTISTDTTAPTYTFGLFDNITVTSIPISVSVSATAPTATEGGSDGVFTVSRVGDTSSSLTVNYLLSGTATNGVDYTTLPGNVTFAAGAASTNITVAAINDSEAELTETVVLTLDPGAGYEIGTPASATVAIVDNEPATLTISATQPILLECFNGSKATFTVTRSGLTNAAITANINYTGTATSGVDFSGPSTVQLAAGAATATLNITPIADKISEGAETAIANIASGSYTIGSPAAATANIVEDLPPGNPLFAEIFDTASSANNWAVNSYSGGVDTFVQFGYDYSADGIPEAPASTGVYVAQRGLKMRVNEVTNSPANGQDIGGLSVSPLNGNFNGNYRLRCDMWINYAGPLNSASVPGQTQQASAGVGTTGVEAMWPGGTASEGVWFSANGDGESAAVTGDFNAYSGTTLFADGTGVYAAGDTNGVRDNLNAYYAPWNGVTAPAAVVTAHPTQTGTTFANTLGSAWHCVAITKRGTNVTWDIDGRRMATVDASALSLSTNVFVGFHDPFSSVTTNPASQFGLFDNVRVETLGRPTITSIQKISGTQVQVDFIAELEDTPDLFQLQAAGTVTAGFDVTAATITSLGGNQFRAVASVGGTTRFYRVRRF